MDRNEIPLDLCHLGVPSGMSKIIFWVYGTFGTNHAPSTQKLTFSLDRPKWDSTWPTSHRRSTSYVENIFWAYGTFGANRAAILREDYHYLQTDRIELSLEPHHLGVPSGVSKTVSEPMVHFTQTVHLSCTDTNTVSKWSEMRFHMTHVT
jgi:hypothetical protein